MKYVKTVLLAVALLVVLSLCGTVVLKIFDIIMDINIDNIFYSGIQVGLVAFVLLMVGRIVKQRKVAKQSK